MGLDMFLYKIICPRKDDVVTFNGVVLPNVFYIKQEVAYWRKANAIHKWFVDNIPAWC